MTDDEYFAVARNILQAAASESYPSVVDQAAPGDVLGVAAVLTIETLDRLDDEMVLAEAVEVAYYSRSDLTDQERAIVIEALELLTSWDGLPKRDVLDRASARAAFTNPVDVLAVVSVIVQLLQFAETLKPGVLAALDGELEMQAWVAKASEKLAITTTLEDL